MKIEDIKSGDFVIINCGDLEKTDKIYHVNHSMRLMKGKRYQVNRVSTSRRHGEPMVIVEGYSWHPDDLLPDYNDIQKEPQVFHFDSEGLDI